MSETALAVQNGGELARRLDDPEMVRTLKDTVCKGATDSQFRMFVEICRSTGLNPFLREIWYVPSVGVMAGRDGYLRVANENKNFDGMETTVERDAKNLPIKATCRVWRKDRSHPITCEAFYSEYKKTGNVWQTYPSAMISKVAEVLALKRSFSINGVVTEEEIGNDEERGSHEAQKAVAEKKIAEMKAKPAAEAIIDIEPEPVALPPAHEAEADVDKFEALARFAELKKKMREETGSDDLYYRALGNQGYEKSNLIERDNLRKVYRAVAKEFTTWKSEQPMPGEAA